MTKQTNTATLFDKPENHEPGIAEDYMGSDHGLVNVIDDDDDIDDEDDMDDDLDVDEIDVVEGDEEDGVGEVVPTDDDIDDDLSLDDDDDEDDDDL